VEYPHRRYLKYLLTRRLADAEIMHACSVRTLLPPTEDDLVLLRREVGKIPSCWAPDLDGRNSRLYRWLRDRGVLDLWRQGKEATDAAGFLYAHDTGGMGPRPDLHHLLLLEWDVPKARQQLALKYGETRVPSVAALEVYAKFFWNIREMSQSGAFNYLQLLEENETQLAAYSGDLAATYGLIGLRQRIEDEEFYDNVIALAHEQVQYARRSPHKMSAQKILGIAAMVKVADTAIQSRRDIRSSGMGDTIKKELQAFRLRKRKPAAQLPSYEDLLLQEAEEDNVITIHPLEAVE
jgi:hypothetical protein